jgi:hypothetical protein
MSNTPIFNGIHLGILGPHPLPQPCQRLLKCGQAAFERFVAEGVKEHLEAWAGLQSKFDQVVVGRLRPEESHGQECHA